MCLCERWTEDALGVSNAFLQIEDFDFSSSLTHVVCTEPIMYGNHKGLGSFKYGLLLK